MKRPRLLIAFIFSLSLASPLFAQPADRVPAQYTLSQNDLKTSLQEIDSLLQKGSLLEAKENYKLLLQHELSAEDRQSVRSALEALNMNILFSPVLTPDSFFYTVEPDDSLYEIAKKYHTTIDLIRKSNRLTKDVIVPGKKLKVTKTVFTVKIDKSENKLWLYAGEEVLKTYRVATGKDNSTPIGTFTIENKLEHPTWYTTGAVVPPGSPKNMLGTRWLGFSLESYGIHGTIAPETIGTQDSQGCIRMLNEEVEELYAIVPYKTKVTVVD